MEQRISPRREVAASIELVSRDLCIVGTIRNISEDGALIKVDGATRFTLDNLGDRIELGASVPNAVQDLPRAGKLVRIFEVDSVQYIALRFLDYLGTNRE